MYPRIVQDLIELAENLLPGVGRRQATRFIFGLLKRNPSDIIRFGSLIKSLPDEVAFCPQCFRIHDNAKTLCAICGDTKRDQKTIAIVEKESDVTALEKMKTFQGVYHVLGELMPLLENKKGLNSTMLEALKNRIKEKEIKEIIFALPTTPEGDITTAFLEKKLAKNGLKMTRLARGLSSGTDIEYADPETLRQSFELRK